MFLSRKLENNKIEIKISSIEEICMLLNIFEKNKLDNNLIRFEDNNMYVILLNTKQWNLSFNKKYYFYIDKNSDIILHFDLDNTEYISQKYIPQLFIPDIKYFDNIIPCQLVNKLKKIDEEDLYEKMEYWSLDSVMDREEECAKRDYMIQKSMNDIEFFSKYDDYTYYSDEDIKYVFQDDV